MKKFILFACAAVLGLGASAQGYDCPKDGFYRVQNVGTQRYAYIVDNTGSLNLETTSADMGAMALIAPAERNRYTDAASVFYVNAVKNGSSYKNDVKSQNTGFYQTFGHYIKIEAATTAEDEYRIHETKTNRYLVDGVKSTHYDVSYVDIDKKDDNEKVQLWKCYPVDFENEYLGIDAPLQAGEKYYKPYIVGFDMKLSDGMKAYYVSDVKHDAVVIKPIEGDVVPANTPVIIETASAAGVENKVTLQYPAAAPKVADNKLMGNYFCYEDHGNTAYKQFVAKKMRLLSVVDGKLVYTNKADKLTTTLYLEEQELEFQAVNANESYLKVDENAPAELPVMTEGEYVKSHIAHIVELILNNDYDSAEDELYLINSTVTVGDLTKYIDSIKK